MTFIGRQRELDLLNRFINTKTASLLVVRGRRRIGKSRLIEEFAKMHTFYSISGVAPTNSTSAQAQRDEFASQLSRHGMPRVRADDWNDLFWMLADKVQQGKVIILLDEISWMGSKDPHFLGKLKNAWDQHFKKNPNLILILCGSASSWIEKNILSSTGFLGRISHTLTVEELPLKDCRQFWGKKANNISTQEKLKILSVTGGVPRYLEEIDPSLSAEENIRNLCFTKGALLVDEFNNIFANVFLRKSGTYKQLAGLLSSGAKDFNTICKVLNQDSSGRVLEYLEELRLSGFVKRNYTWHIKTGTDAKLSKFRLSDNYLRFYLKYIEKNKTKIERNSFDFNSLSALPNWYSMMGFQFENLVLNNNEYIWDKLGIIPEDIVSENPYFQHKTTRQQGCQIDYLIQTKFSTLYVCEIKFSKHPVPNAVINEVQNKIDALKRPKGMSCRPVLIHVNGVDDTIMDEDYFSSIIDFSHAISN